MRRLVAAVAALALATVGLALIPLLSGPPETPVSRLDPLAALLDHEPRPLSRAQLAALERYGHPSGARNPGAARPLDPPADTSRITALERRLVVAGELLRSSPQPAAAVIATVPATAHVPVVSERGGWVLVRLGETSGWIEGRRLVRLGEPAGTEPPLGSEPTPTLPRAATPADPARLAAARAHLDLGRTRTRRVGPWTLLTDVEDATALALLERAAAKLDAAYRARFGVTPIGQPLETVVLFADESAYQAFRRSEGAAQRERVAGHATAGLAALALGERGAEAAAESLVHELTHLLNRRAIGPALPPWLDEGLANDLALARLSADGTPLPGTLSSRRRPSGSSEVTIDGGEALALVARRRLGRLVPLERLLQLDATAFLSPGESELHYAQSLLFVRYLLDGADGAHRDAFRSFLRAVSEGAPIDPEAFRAHLGPSWRQLQASFETWLGFSVLP